MFSKHRSDITPNTSFKSIAKRPAAAKRQRRCDLLWNTQTSHMHRTKNIMPHSKVLSCLRVHLVAVVRFVAHVGRFDHVWTRWPCLGTLQCRSMHADLAR